MTRSAPQSGDFDSGSLYRTPPTRFVSVESQRHADARANRHQEKIPSTTVSLVLQGYFERESRTRGVRSVDAAGHLDQLVPGHFDLACNRCRKPKREVRWNDQVEIVQAQSALLEKVIERDLGAMCAGRGEVWALTHPKGVVSSGSTAAEQPLASDPR